MPRPRKVPWIALRVDLDEHDKLAALPNDTARWGWVRALLRAKTQRRMGVFANRTHLRDLLGRHGRFVDAYIGAGLAHIVPIVCRDCRARYVGVTSGEIVIHDFLEEQRDPTNAERQERWRAEHAASQDGANLTPNVTAEGDANVTAHSRARAATATATTTERRDRAAESVASGRPRGRGPSKEPRLTRAQLEEWAEFDHPDWQPFKAAWMARGLLHPPAGDIEDDTTQAGLLAQVADARPAELGQWIAEAPGRSAREAVEHVLERWHAIRDGVTRAELEWRAAKDQERRDAEAAMARVGDLLG